MTKSAFLSHFPMKSSVGYQPLSKFGMFIWLCSEQHVSKIWSSPPIWKISPVATPTKFLLSLPKVNPPPPLNKNFHIVSQKNFIFSCSYFSCTIFILPSYSLHTKVMLLLILMNVQYLQFVSHQPRKHSPPHAKVLIPPTPYSNAIWKTLYAFQRGGGPT